MFIRPQSLLIPALFFVLSAHAVEIIAHRGASADAPENTLPAFELAWQQGADGIEGDFFLSGDGHIVCIHDRSTHRLAKEKLDVTRSNYADLRKLDVGEGAHIPSLAEVFATLPADHGRVFIEIKDSARLVEPLAKQLKAVDLPLTRLAVIAFKEDVVRACKRAIPDLKVHWLVGAGTYEKKGLDGVLATLKAIGADGIDIQASKALKPDLGEALRAAGLEFHCWTVNDMPLARHMIALGVDSITTDKPAFIRRAIDPAPVPQRMSFEDEVDGPSGIVGKAMSARIVKTDQPLPDIGTVALWYRPVAWYDYQTIFDSTSHPNEWELWINKSAEIGFRTTGADLRVTYQLHPVATRDQWQHLAVTWDARELRFYVNSALVVKAPRRAPSPSKGNFCLGGGNPGNTPGRGHWDEVLIHSTALPAADIRSLMLKGIDGWLVEAQP